MSLQYSVLKANIASWLERDDLTSQLDIFVRAAMRKLERKHDFKHMEGMVSGSFTSGTSTLAILPARYKNNILFRVSVNGQWELVKKDSLEYALNAYPDPTGDVGYARLFAYDYANSQLLFRPTPDSNYSYEWYYRAYSAALSADADTNWWTDNADEVLMFAALEEANLFIRNLDKAAVWKKKKEEALSDVMMVDIQERFSGAGATVKQDYSLEDT